MSTRTTDRTNSNIPVVTLVAVATAAIAAYGVANPELWKSLHQKYLAILLFTTAATTARSSSSAEEGTKEQEKESSSSTIGTHKVPDSLQQQEQETATTTTSFTMQPIGTIRSIYRLCVGTPRQGLLAPQARGRIELTVDNALDMVDGLEHYSHIWIVFVFHLNTTSSSKKKKPTKIAPPALGGQKVGVLATRSPHRASRIGMTLAQLDTVQIVGKKNKKKQQKARVVLHISGLDLVDGTPVLDLKPYVPTYDSIPNPEDLEVPSWVSGGLATRRPVNITAAAQQELHDILKENPTALEFYGPHCGDAVGAGGQVLTAIEQVLAVDVRSAWQTKKARRGQSQAERAVRVKDLLTTPADAAEPAVVSSSQLCTQQLDNLLIHYSVDAPSLSNRAASQGSGAEDVVTVHSIQLLLTTTASSQQYEDERSLRSRASTTKSHGAASKTVSLPSVASSSSTQQQSSSEATPPPQSPPPSRVPPPPMEGDSYDKIQSYFAQAGTANTPRGVSPSLVKAVRDEYASQPRELRNSLSGGRLMSLENSPGDSSSMIQELTVPTLASSSSQQSTPLRNNNNETHDSVSSPGSFLPEMVAGQRNRILNRQVSDSSGVYFDTVMSDGDTSLEVQKGKDRTPTTTTSDLSSSCSDADNNDNDDDEDEYDSDDAPSYVASDAGGGEDVNWWYSVTDGEYLALNENA